MRLATDGLLSFSRVPLRLSVGVGLAAIAVSFVVCMGLAFAYRQSCDGRPAIGDPRRGWQRAGGHWRMGAYVVRIFEESKGRPLYVLKEAWPTSPTGDQRGDGPRPATFQAGFLRRLTREGSARELAFAAVSGPDPNVAVSRGQRWIIAGLLLAVIALGAVTEIRSAYLKRRMTDLDCYLRAAWAIRTSVDPYSVVEENGWHYCYPHFLAVMLGPLAAPAARALGSSPCRGRPRSPSGSSSARLLRWRRFTFSCRRSKRHSRCRRGGSGRRGGRTG